MSAEHAPYHDTPTRPITRSILKNSAYFSESKNKTNKANKFKLVQNIIQRKFRINGLYLALRHEKQKVNLIVMTAEKHDELSSREGVAQSFGFDSSSSLVVDF
ncbi:UNVERIFIED_CONTAM: hypothetical protein NCL1_30793 [Trichonephila clavipes]